jgi:hypothetical protein
MTGVHTLEATIPAQAVPSDAVPSDVPAPVCGGGLTEAVARLAESGVTLLAGFSRPGARFAAVKHVLVGRSGVFVVVAAEPGTRLLDGAVVCAERDGARLVADVVDAAAAVAELLPRLDPALVHPVLCLPGDAEVETTVGGVRICSAGTLARVVTAGPDVMDAERAGFLGRRLAVQQQPVSGAPAVARRRGLRGLLRRR